MEQPAPDLDVRVLGQPSVRVGGHLVQVGGRKPTALLYALAVRPGGLTRAELAELFWGPGRRSNLRAALYQLRRSPGGDAWLDDDLDADTLRLRGRSDLAEFERRFAAKDHTGALALWSPGALALSADSCLLAGFDLSSAPAFHDWLDAERRRVHGLVRACALRRAERLVEDGEFETALSLLEALAAEDPLDEELHRRVMVVASRAGDRPRAMRQYETCRRALHEGLGLPPVETTSQLAEAIRLDTVGAPGNGLLGGTRPSGSTEIPFVGRRRELASLRVLLGEERWLTLSGPGGVGKTRLAWALADELRAHDRRPVAFVPLDAVVGAEFAVAAIANVVQVAFEGPESPIVQLARGLSGRRTLLVLDNAEHLQPELGDAIERLLDLTPDLQVVTTSRLPAGRPSERTFRVEGLEGPVGPHDPGAADRDAVRLFVTAAQRVAPTFRMDASVAADVVRVCSALRGHALGLRLAAGWLRFRSCAELADATSGGLLALDNPGLSLDPRHAGLRRVMESSWTLLGAEDAELVARLSSFRGPFDAATAYAVAGAGVSALARLDAAGWLQAAGPGRYDLHPMIHEFGLERLRASADGAQVEQRHARLYLERMAARHHAILGPDPRDALDATEADWENLRAAWTFAAGTGRHAELAAAAEPLSLYADMRVRFLEAERMFAEAVESLQPFSAEAIPVAIVAMCGRGMHLFRLSRFAEALEVAEAASRLARATPSLDVGILHRPTKLRGDVLVGAGRYEEALSAYRAALAASQESLPGRVSRDLRSLANVEAVLGHTRDAESHYRAAIERNRTNGYRVGLAIDLNNLAELLISGDRLDEAESMIEESLGIAEGVDVHLVPYLELNLADLTEKRGDLATTVQHARRALELAQRYSQSSIRSRAQARLASAALRSGDRAEAIRRLDAALRIARGADEPASALHALVVQARLDRARGDEANALRCLAVVVDHPASEARDVQEAGHLLGSERPTDAAPPLKELLDELIGAS